VGKGTSKIEDTVLILVETMSRGQDVSIGDQGSRAKRKQVADGFSIGVTAPDQHDAVNVYAEGQFAGRCEMTAWLI
jgi:hypothetical protein